MIFDTAAPTILDIISYADKVGTIAVLFVAFVGLHRRWWVPGWVFRGALERLDKLEEEKNAWRDTALKASNVATDAFTELRRRV